jgi:CCS family citrate carrier protein
MAELAAIQNGAAVIGTPPEEQSNPFNPLYWRIGIFPLPLFALALGLIAIFVAQGKVPADLTTQIVVLTVGGFACAEIGKRLPVLRRLGAAAILATFVPSFLVYVNVIPAPLKESIATFSEQSNFLYLFIMSIVVGSILGMDRHVLIRGFVKIFVPILSGSIVGAAVGCTVGTMLGMGLQHTVFKVVLPVMAGGLGEGVIPLSVGYASLSGGNEGEYLAELIPPMMFGSLVAVLLAGGLNLLGRKRPDLTGNGALQPGEHDVPLTGKEAPRFMPDLPTVGAAVVMVMVLYLIGLLVQKFTGFPGPVAVLFLTVVIKLAKLVSPRLERGAYRNYQFFASLVTYPLLFAMGVAKTPWEKLIAAFNAPALITIVCTVVSLTATGFFVARLVRLHPVEAGIVTACRASQGGTGDVAILSACDRMQLMPFAQVATRIGGAITVTIALALFAKYGF